MLSLGFLGRKWSKRHEHLVEDCICNGRALHVGDVLPELAHGAKVGRARWSRPSHPHLTLVSRMGGPVLRWWFLCPRCQGRCETLYVPPHAPRDAWACRTCHGLIYASQR